MAVLDTGVDLTHPDLQANLLPGYDAASGGATGNLNGGPWTDPTWSRNNAHGTACAGIIGAINNNIGVVGIASGCKIVPIRIGWVGSTNSAGQGVFTFSTPGLGSGIRYAWETAQADVLSNSWGGRSYTLGKEFQDAMNYGRDGKGCVVVFSAGNDNTNSANQSNSDPRVIIVGAMSPSGERKSPTSSDGEYWWGSSYGTALDVVAPGVLIPTTDLQGDIGYNKTVGTAGNYHNTFNGTSAACPHVAGVAALILSVNPNLTGKQSAEQTSLPGATRSR